MGSNRKESLYLYLVNLLDPATHGDTELPCEVQIPTLTAAGKAEFMLMGRVWFLTQDLGQVTSSVKWGQTCFFSC